MDHSQDYGTIDDCIHTLGNLVAVTQDARVPEDLRTLMLYWCLILEGKLKYMKNPYDN